MYPHALPRQSSGGHFFVLNGAMGGRSSKEVGITEVDPNQTFLAGGKGEAFVDLLIRWAGSDPGAKLLVWCITHCVVVTQTRTTLGYGLA